MTASDIAIVAQMPYGTYREMTEAERPLTRALLLRSKDGDLKAIDGKCRLIAGYIALRMVPPS